MAIQFHDEKIISGLKNRRSKKSWINKILDKENKKAGQISIIFTTDNHLREINLQYLKRDYYTDVITFDYSEGSFISGDIFISLERVEENAKKYGTGKENEILRVMAHGILHLIGYKDSNEEERISMKRMENICLGYYNESD